MLIEHLCGLISASLGQMYISANVKKVIQAINNHEDSSMNYTQFRTLKVNYHNIGLYEEEDKVYRAYMKYFTRKWYRLPLKLFQIFGSFGTRPSTIILAMLVTWGGYGLYFWLKLKDQLDPIATSIWDALYYSGITFLTIGYGDISPALEGSMQLRFVSVFEGFIGLFLMSYLTVAVVRKLLR